MLLTVILESWFGAGPASSNYNFEIMKKYIDSGKRRSTQYEFSSLVFSFTRQQRFRAKTLA